MFHLEFQLLLREQQLGEKYRAGSLILLLCDTLCPYLIRLLLQLSQLHLKPRTVELVR